MTHPQRQWRRTMAGALLGPLMFEGCLVEGEPVYPADAAAGGAGGLGGAGFEAGPTPTWDDVEPILEEKCGGCHGDPLAGGAPFILITYDGAAAHAERAAARAAAGTMPPPGLGFERCTPDEVAALQAWAEAGAPET